MLILERRQRRHLTSAQAFLCRLSLRGTGCFRVAFLLLSFCLTPQSAAGAKHISAIDLSPDGKTLVTAVDGDLLLVDRESGMAQRITDGASWDEDPKWSPDGRFIAYAQNRWGKRTLVIRNVQTSAEWTLGNQYASVLSANRISLRSWNQAGIVSDFQFGDQTNTLFVAEFVPSERRSRLITVNIFTNEFSKIRDGFYRTFSVSERGSLLLYSNFFTIGKEDLVTGVREIVASELLTGYLSPVVSSKGTEYFYIENVQGREFLIRNSSSLKQRAVVATGIWGNNVLDVGSQGELAFIAIGGRISEIDIHSGNQRLIEIRGTSDRRSPPNRPIIIKNVDVFDGMKDVVTRRDVIISHGLITDILESTSGASDYEGFDVIDGTGQFLMAGLVDSHSHVGFQPPRRLQDLLFEGVTSVIDPSSIYPYVCNLKSAEEAGKLASPTIYAFSSRIRGPAAVNPTHAGFTGYFDDPKYVIDLVRSHARQCFEGIKIYSALGPDVSRGAIAEAKRLGLLTIGHLGELTWAEGVRVGIDALTHASLYFLCDEPFSGAGNRYRDWTPPDENCLTYLFEEMSRRGATFDPTITDSVAFLKPVRQYQVRQQREPNRDFEKEFGYIAEVVLLAHQANVNMVIGRDDWDWSMVHEMQAYERIGLPRADILRMATRNAAKFLGRDSEFGTVEIGKRADLILVNGDPLASIRDLSKLTVVIKQGEIVLIN